MKLSCISAASPKMHTPDRAFENAGLGDPGKGGQES